jgi:formate--tetrahydrofolate ligase
VNECGFASDLGFEKYMDIVMPASGIRPAAAVLVTTLKSVATQGEGSLERGFANLGKHIQILRGFGLPTVVALNQFPNDAAEELAKIEAFCREQGANFALSQAFSKGGEGAIALAEEVVRTIEAEPEPAVISMYGAGDSAEEKIGKVARGVYGAKDVEFSDVAKAKLAQFAKWGFGEMPVCIAKTQYSLTDDPKLPGAPRGWTLHINDVSLSAGAGFLVAISGSMMLMPGLPKESRAALIDVDAEGNVTGMA